VIAYSRGDTVNAYHHASTAAEGQMRGMADLVRSQGQANLDHSAAAVNYSVARRNEMNNRLAWTHTYFQMREANRAYRAAERGPRPTMESLTRFAQAGRPRRLSSSELDPVSGEITWPMLLEYDAYATDRAELEGAFTRRAYRRAITAEDYAAVKETTAQMLNRLKEQVRQVSQSPYIAAKKFIESLAYEADVPPA
jgi:Txe/YoeB family toxin of Txe-Axe toxin-antitoxin module